MSYRETASSMYPSVTVLAGALLAQHLGLMFLGSLPSRPNPFALQHPCSPKRSKRRVCSPAPVWMRTQCGYARRRVLKSRPLPVGARNPCGLLPYPAMLRSCFTLRPILIPTCDCDWCMKYRVGCEQATSRENA